MHPYLIRLGVPLAVQDFFLPYWQNDAAGNLLFDYQDSFEHYGMVYHKVPSSAHFWIGGDPFLSRRLIITSSAMQGITYLGLHPNRTIEGCVCLATGNRLNKQQLHWIRHYGKGKSCALVFENSPLGNLTDLKMAAGIKGIPVAIFSEPENGLRIRFRMKDYRFNAERFTLSRFEKACGFRFGLRTAKSKTALTFLDQIKASPLIPNL